MENSSWQVIAPTTRLPNHQTEVAEADCPVLNLCKRDLHSSSPEGARQQQYFPQSIPTAIIDDQEPPTSTILSSSGSESSEPCDPLRDYTSYLFATGRSQNKLKAPRPFKIFTKNPYALAVGPGLNEEEYVQFRNRMLSQVNGLNGITNKNMRRTSQSANTAQNDDPSYREKRRKNNEAAKRSRDARRAKEDEIAIRAAFLEQENLKLRCENSILKRDIQELIYRNRV